MAVKQKDSRFKKILKILGPGLVTGASDDDPSGIATYSQAGAQFGLDTLWTALITFPLMAAVQGMCARIGVVTTQGLTATLKEYYPKWILWMMILFSFPAIILNIGADIAGMGAVANLIFPAVPSFAFSIIFTLLIMLGVIYFPYQRFAAVLKWFCIILLVYLVVPFITDTNWPKVLHATVMPTIKLDKDFMSTLVAILGTTISPYLFFWQATMEAEDVKQKNQIMVDKQLLSDVREDVNIGMFFSNLVMYFIILTCGTVLYSHGVHKIDTVEQAANALRPVAGDLTYALFALGIIGTGFLGIPVLSGSISYMCAETFNWKSGLDKKFFQAKPFYGVVIVSLIVGVLINYLGLNPIHELFYTAILYGLTAPVMIAVVLHISNNKKIMGSNTNKLHTNIFGWITLILMSVSAIYLLYLLV